MSYAPPARRRTIVELPSPSGAPTTHPDGRPRRATALLLLALAAGALGWASSHRPDFTGPPTVDGIVGTAALALGWLCVAWLAAGVALSVLATLPGWLGAVASAIAPRIAPAIVRHLVAVALGTGLAVAPAAYASAVPPPASAIVTAQAVTEVPVTAAATGEQTVAGGVAASLPGTPTLPPLDWPTADAPPLGAVTVVPGDTLWAIAARALPDGATDAEIDAEWRRWYAANVAVVGPDPDLIYPGQRLVRPDSFSDGGAS